MDLSFKQFLFLFHLIISVLQTTTYQCSKWSKQMVLGIYLEFIDKNRLNKSIHSLQIIELTIDTNSNHHSHNFRCEMIRIVLKLTKIIVTYTVA